MSFEITPFVHPELQPFVETMKGFTAPALTAEMLLQARSQPMARPPLPEPAWSEHMIPSASEGLAVRIYVINLAPGDAARPAILYIHGGGFVVGNAHSTIHAAQELAKTLNCTVVSVDYRLAPETTFPGALEDNYTALKWLYAHAEELGVDRARIAVMGESAGGGHAAMLAIAARNRGEVPIAYQALVYPMLDDRTGKTPLPPQQGALIWTPASNRFGWTSLLGMPAGSAEVPLGSVPARVEDLRGLPPTFIGVGSIDLFVRENIDYARRLIDAGVATTLNVVPGAFHGFDVVGAQTQVVKGFKSALFNALSQAFAVGH